MAAYDDARWIAVRNPNFSDEDFADGNRQAPLDGSRGVHAIWSPRKQTGEWKPRLVLFDRDQWPDEAACRAHVDAEREALKVAGNYAAKLATGLPATETATLDATLVDTGRKSTAPTADQLETINAMALEPLDAGDVYVRRMRLTNDQWGKHHVRLSRGFQRNVMGTLPGKSLLMGHPEMSGFPAEPIGRFFGSSVERDPETGVEWGYAEFYIVKTAQNEHARSQIDGGVWKHTSIGFDVDWRECSICGLDIADAKCSHIPGQTYPLSAVKDAALSPEPVPTDPDSVYCGITFRGQGRAQEGSIVYLGELNGTEILSAGADRYGTWKRAQLQSGDGGGTGIEAGSDEDRNPSGEDRSSGGSTTPPTGGENMADESKIAVLEAQMTALTTEKGALDGQLAEATQALETLQEQHAQATAALAAQKPLIESEKTLRAAAVAEIERLAGLVGREAELATMKDVAGDDLAGLSAEKLLQVTESWTKVLDASLPGRRQSTGAELPPHGGARDDTTPEGESAEARYMPRFL